MAGIFASQFNQVSPYEPVGLDTGTPSIGVTLGKKTPKRPPTEEPANVRPGSGGEAPAAAGAAIAATAGMSASNAAAPGTSLAAQQAKSQTYNKLMHLEAQDTAGGDPRTIKAPAPSSVNMPKHSGADATPPKQSGGFMGFLDSVGHEATSIAHNPIVSSIMHFGDPFNDHGVSGAVADQSQTNPTIKPTRVYNPQRPSAQGIESGKPGTVQGTVEGNPAVDVAARGALGRSTAYDNLAGKLGPQFYRNGGSTVSRLTSTPWYDQIPNDLGSLAEDAFAGL